MENNKHFKEWESVVNFIKDYCDKIECSECAFDNRGICHCFKLLYEDKNKMTEAMEIIKNLRNNVI